MTATELLTTYPNIPQIIAWMEIHVFRDNVLNSGPGAAPEVQRMVSEGADLPFLVGVFRDVLDDILLHDKPANHEQLIQAREQLNHPEFAHYLTASLGLL